ncbi:MAG TPA: DUF6266 family protein [Pedobacter sp.]|nr:DUF6266 family protein [Pedobacter sp.]
MARYKNGINGPVSGKVGTVVAASWRGIDYLRSVSDTRNVKWTEAQVLQRLKMAAVMAWLKPLLVVINIGFQAFREKKTPLNAAVSYHLKEALKGEPPEYEIDFKKAIFSIGVLLVSFVREVLGIGNALLHLKWENGVETAYSAPGDRATFIVYNKARERFVTFENEAVRADGEATLQLPEEFEGDTVHCYMFYVGGKMVSTSSYLGEVVVA